MKPNKKFIHLWSHNWPGWKVCTYIWTKCLEKNQNRKEGVGCPLLQDEPLPLIYDTLFIFWTLLCLKMMEAIAFKPGTERSHPIPVPKSDCSARPAPETVTPRTPPVRLVLICFYTSCSESLYFFYCSCCFLGWSRVAPTFLSGPARLPTQFREFFYYLLLYFNDKIVLKLMCTLFCFEFLL